MTELERIGVTAAASGIVGYVAGIAQMWWKHQRDDRLRREDDLKSFGEAFLTMREKDKNFDYTDERQLSALQKLGAYRFSRAELKSFQTAIIARGLPDPLSGHMGSLGYLPDYPFCVFKWARDHHVDLGDCISVFEALIATLEKSVTSLSCEQEKQLRLWQLGLGLAQLNRSKEAQPVAHVR